MAGEEGVVESSARRHAGRTSHDVAWSWQEGGVSDEVSWDGMGEYGLAALEHHLHFGGGSLGDTSRNDDFNFALCLYTQTRLQ